MNVFLSRYLEASISGWLYYLSSILAFIQLIVGFSLEAGLTYFGSSQKVGYNRLFWFSVIWILVITIIVCLTLFFYPGNFIKNDIVSHNKIFLYAVCYILGQLMMIYGANLFYAQGNFLAPNCIMFVLNISFVIIIPKSFLQIIYLPVKAILDIYFLLFVAQGLVMMFAFAIKNKSYKEVHFPSVVDFKKLFRYSALALAANIIFFLVYRIDYWFVNNSPVSSPKDLGNYIQVSKLGQILWVIPQIIASAVFPQVASGFDRKVVNNSVMILARLFAQVFIIILIVAILFGNNIFIAVFGPTFNDMKTPFILLTPGIYFLSVLALLSAYFSGKGNVMINVKGAFAALIFVFIADYFFVSIYGIYAAAVISTIGYGLNLAYALRQFYKDYHISMIDFFKWRRSDYAWLKNMLQTNKE